MGVLLRKQRGIILTTIAKLSLVLFVSSFAFALIDTVWAVYVDSFVNSIFWVGMISAAFTVISFLSFFWCIPLVERTNKSKLYAYSLFFFAISYVLFAINENFYVMILLGAITTILHTLRITSFGIILKDKSSEKKLSRNEGLAYTFMNLAWLIGPLFAGLIAEKYGISMIFGLSAVLITLTVITFMILHIRDGNVKKKTDENLFKNFKDFFKNKNRRMAYIIGGGVNFWWSLIYLFIPLFIIRGGLSDRWIGYFLFAVAVPLLGFQYVFSKLAGRIGFKKVFKIGFLIPAVLGIACFFVGNIYVILGLLILGSFGMAMLEANTEAYFFDVLRGKEDLKYYGPYNTTIDVNHFISRGLASIVVFFFPFKYLFLFFGFSMFVFFLISFKVKNVIENRKDGKKNKY